MSLDDNNRAQMAQELHAIINRNPAGENNDSSNQSRNQKQLLKQGQVNIY